jgi:GMP synthase (glutamine-hydrolysing)
MNRRILVVLHQADSTPGRGYELDRRCPMLGHPLPHHVEDYAAAVVFGGPQSANDDALPGIRDELRWIEQSALPAALPLLGICLGAQLTARVLGAEVAPHPEGLVEIGYTEIAATDDGGDFIPAPTHFFQWHEHAFGIPAGAVRLAESQHFPNQAFRYGRQVYGLEFHPEMTRAMVERWGGSEEGCEELLRPGAQPHAEHLAGFDRFAAESDRWLHRFLDDWLGDTGAYAAPTARDDASAIA